MVVSEVISTNLMVLGCLKEKIVVNPWAPDDFFFSLTPQFKEPLLLAVGRFVDKKAPYYTILAYIKVVKKYLKAKLHFIGKGELDNVCKNLLKYCNLQESILFLGVLNSNEIAEYFQRALVFVQHSIIADNGDSEGTPLSILEASAAGIPIIFYKHKGIIDVLDDEVSGFLVEEYDVF
jgi:colanic acid/amylovoran biosynthesis glycosyltransferase